MSVYLIPIISGITEHLQDSLSSSFLTCTRTRSYTSVLLHNTSNPVMNRCITKLKSLDLTEQLLLCNNL